MDTPKNAGKRPLESPGTPSPYHKQTKMAAESPECSGDLSHVNTGDLAPRLDKMFDVLIQVKKGQDSLRKTFDSNIERLRKDVLSTIDDKMKAVKVDVDLQFSALENRIQEFEVSMNSVSSGAGFPADKTVKNTYNGGGN